MFTKSAKRWIPTEEEIRQYCGLWYKGRQGHCLHVTISALAAFVSAESFEDYVKAQGFVRVEPIPEQCIPKMEPEKPKYEILFPLLAGKF